MHGLQMLQYGSRPRFRVSQPEWGGEPGCHSGAKNVGNRSPKAPVSRIAVEYSDAQNHSKIGGCSRKKSVVGDQQERSPTVHIGNAQDVHALQNVQDALRAAGANVSDVIRARIYVARCDDWTEVARAHAEVFGDVQPAPDRRARRAGCDHDGPRAAGRIPDGALRSRSGSSIAATPSAIAWLGYV